MCEKNTLNSLSSLSALHSKDVYINKRLLYGQLETKKGAACLDENAGAHTQITNECILFSFLPFNFNDFK